MTILDVKAQDEKGVWYDVEMQLGYQSYIMRRVMYYWSQVYTGQIEAKGRYGNLNKVISIVFMDFSYLPGKQYHHIFRLLNSITHEELDDFCELHFIEMQKFRKELPQVHTAIDRWITFLNRAAEYSSKRLPPELAVDPMVEQAVSKLEMLSMTGEEWEIYRDRAKFQMDQIAIIEAQIEKAREEALSQGRAEGQAQGRAEGEFITKKKLARQLLDRGFAVTEAAEMTGLSVAETEQLAKE